MKKQPHKSKTLPSSGGKFQRAHAAIGIVIVKKPGRKPWPLFKRFASLFQRFPAKKENRL